ncbi:PREDICTED: uncharacterized protein LOC105562439 isoform X1 [Vollenhovia emeryi]|uniref:uncharacterized protein LOC105562439 isoform X1 n=1 Tax=Vollenhovia emeryi TaxID=411798 RepID=UPI0005F5253C|nr:PREDICTED: uncharacterized protein LOC105562439 isoform X1 [Vollenhovia emeryi]XP_011868673.1 PREDICTED: uncharacterized protein LOC105562439 isoform X1 [Vollenhovia emeryi]XP_011868674.1 PREDICTED: uncharacterized protein LOC105562439 isoform X1 [Vollenhovia emeryi]XP_011868675.1 PREDICTED: uncharacterized protein LOC105562439 isoform X1 [Vollenhovia emeryi]
METSDKLNKRKRRFSDCWLKDERFNTWIRKVPLDDSVFHCIICDKDFACSSSSHIERHARSEQHKKNIDKDPLELDESSKKKSLCRKMFRPQWLEIERFKPWLREVENDANAFFCAICDKTITGGLSQICRHAKSNAHKSKCGQSDTPIYITNTDVNLQVDESLLLFEEQKKSAEIRYAALIADKNIPHETAKLILHFFQDVAKNPNVLKSMSMGRTKCTNIISNVLCSVETDYIVSNIQNTKFFVFIDETSDISNEKWMTFHVRYVNPETLQVHSQLIKLVDIDSADCSTEKLFDVFKRELQKLEIPLSNIIALSCDYASLMQGKHLVFKRYLEEMCTNVLTLSCPCLSVELAADAACAKIPQIYEDFVKIMVTYINSSPKRTAIFREFSQCTQESNQKVSELSDTRWLSHYACIEQLLDSWDIIKHFLSETIINEKTDTGDNLLNVMESVEIKAYLLFLKYILHSFNTLNTFFQAAETRIHLLHSKSMNLLTKICTNFLKSQVLKDLPNVTFSKSENHKSLIDINLGLECEEYLCQLMKDGNANVIATIRKNCLQFYVTAAEEIYNRLPVNDVFFSKLQVFLPHTALLSNDRATTYNDVSFIARTIGGFNGNGLKREWFKLSSDFTIPEKQSLSKLNFDDMWIKILQSRYLTDEIKYPHLQSLLNSIRALPNSNTNPDRIFSLLTDIKSKKRNKLSSAVANATCVLKSALKARGETALTMTIDATHLSLMSSDKLYAYFPKKPKNKPPDADDPLAGPSSSNDMLTT